MLVNGPVCGAMTTSTLSYLYSNIAVHHVTQSFYSAVFKLFVYVIGLHAVQFGNNWMRKIPLTAKLD